MVPESIFYIIIKYSKFLFIFLILLISNKLNAKEKGLALLYKSVTTTKEGETPAKVHMIITEKNLAAFSRVEVKNEEENTTTDVDVKVIISIPKELFWIIIKMKNEDTNKTEGKSKKKKKKSKKGKKQKGEFTYYAYEAGFDVITEFSSITNENLSYKTTKSEKHFKIIKGLAKKYIQLYKFDGKIDKTTIWFSKKSFKLPEKFNLNSEKILTTKYNFPKQKVPFPYGAISVKSYQKKEEARTIQTLKKIKTKKVPSKFFELPKGVQAKKISRSLARKIVRAMNGRGSLAAVMIEMLADKLWSGIKKGASKAFDELENKSKDIFKKTIGF